MADESNGGAADGATEAKKLAFHESGFERGFDADRSEEEAFDFEIGVGVDFAVVADLVIVGEDDGGFWVFGVGLEDFCSVRFVVGIVLMGNGDEWGSSGVDCEVEIAADVGVGAGDDF